MAVTSTGGQQQLESSSNIQTTGWQHVAMTWSSGEVIRFYVNGFEDTPTGTDAATTGTITGCSALVVGKGANDEDANDGWDGLIDDVRIYDYALSEALIRELATPLEAWMPSPEDGAKDVDPNVLLSWLPGAGPPPGFSHGTALEHDVYLGTDWDDVNNAYAGCSSHPPEYMGTYTEPNCFVAGLEPGTDYFWRVDEGWGRFCPLGIGITYKGDVWRFTTKPPDFNNDGSINFLDYAILAKDWMETGPGLEGDIRKDNVVDYKDLRILLENWLWKK
jgi:hypothetical protein